MTAHTPRSALVLLTTCLLAGAVPGQAPRKLEILPVADLLFEADSPRPPRFAALTVEQAGQGDAVTHLLDTGRFVTARPDALMDMLRMVIGESVDHMSLLLRGDTLLVSGTAEQVDAVKAIVTDLRGVLIRRATIQARLYRVPADADFPARMSADELRKRTTGMTPVWSGHAAAHSGQRVVLAQERFTRYVSNVEVEVAEDIAVATPATGSAFEGIRLVVECHDLADTGDRVLKCQFALGESAAPIAMESIGAGRALPRVGIPRLRAASGCFSGRVEAGGALCLTVQSRRGAGSNFLLVVGSTGAKARHHLGTDAILLPVSVLTTTSMRGEVLSFGSGSDPEGARGGYPEVQTEEVADEESGDALLELVRDSLGELLDSEDAEVELLKNSARRPGYLFLRGSEVLRETVTRLVVGLQTSATQGVGVRLQTELGDAPNDPAVFTALADGKQRELWLALSYPVLLGDSSILFHGIESAVVRDYYTHVAKKASLARPVVQRTFSGMAAIVRPSRHGQDLGVALESQVALVSPLARQASPEAAIGELHHVQVDRAEFRHSGRVQQEASEDLGCGPHMRLDDRNMRLHQRVRFRKL